MKTIKFLVWSMYVVIIITIGCVVFLPIIYLKSIIQPEYVHIFAVTLSLFIMCILAYIPFLIIGIKIQNYVNKILKEI